MFSKQLCFQAAKTSTPRCAVPAVAIQGGELLVAGPMTQPLPHARNGKSGPPQGAGVSGAAFPPWPRRPVAGLQLCPQLLPRSFHSGDSVPPCWCGSALSDEIASPPSSSLFLRHLRFSCGLLDAHILSIAIYSYPGPCAQAEGVGAARARGPGEAWAGSVPGDTAECWRGKACPTYHTRVQVCGQLR